ncbi:hypothetical protein I317_07187 [Kwoniella heveanensis CBS 569]|nr:hypothetical protein I317_07187 [Kwoniella heveanensis CBS 569]
MLLRRLYSSAPSPRAAICSTTTATTVLSPSLQPRPPTRGRLRIKPSRLATISSTASTKARNAISTTTTVSSKSAAENRSEIKGRGRTRTGVFAQGRAASSSSLTAQINQVSDSNRLSVEPSHISLFDDLNAVEVDHSHSSSAPVSTGPSSPRLIFTHPIPSADHVNTFKPHYLYPEQFKLHTTFTHPSHPLPLNLGTAIYTHPRKPNAASAPIEGDLFAAPPPPDPTPALKRKVKNSSGLNDHFRVISNLSHPRLSHNLGEHSPFVSGAAMGMAEAEFGSLSNTLGHKVAEIKEASERDWQAVLAQFEPKPASAIEQQSAPTPAQSPDASLSEVVSDLNSTLSRLGLSSTRGRQNITGTVVSANEGLLEDEEVAWMDSVKRKRKKKISKHKYKKRRKVS